MSKAEHGRQSGPEGQMANPIGVIGLRNIGSGMAASLARAGFTVLGLDAAQSTRDRAAMAEEAGAPIPTGAAAVNRAAETHGHLDVSGMLTIACENAGVRSEFG